MTKFPKQLKIGGHIIKVKFVEFDDDRCGEFDTYKNEISICKNLAQSQKEVTLLHEIIHALNSTLDADNDMGHIFIESLSQQLFQVIKDNKLFR